MINIQYIYNRVTTFASSPCEAEERRRESGDRRDGRERRKGDERASKHDSQL